LEPRKRHELAVEAIGRIPAPRRPKLVIVALRANQMKRRRLEQLAGRLGVQLECVFDVTDEELVRWYNRAGAFLHTAVREPFGLVAIEAMACGTPVVAVREGGPQESVQDGVTGLLTDATAEAVASGVDRVVSDAALQQRMGLAGIERVRQLWTWDASVERFERHLRATARQDQAN
jgi:glycosyltransferase involved in cell wall biosynthesis